MSEFENKSKRSDSKEVLYKRARAHMVNAIEVKDFGKAAEMFEDLGDYRDSAKLMLVCRKRIVELLKKNERETAEWNEKYSELKTGKIKNSLITLSVIAGAIILLVYLLSIGSNTPTI